MKKAILSLMMMGLVFLGGISIVVPQQPQSVITAFDHIGVGG
ncbi:hypothetical protein [Paenibacillus elgii]|nr:hypothetical protein [Paenibacillus elgii]